MAVHIVNSSKIILAGVNIDSLLEGFPIQAVLDYVVAGKFVP